MNRQPGSIVMFGSGETSAAGQRAHDFVLRRMAPPIRACVLETPAGFELNSARVAGRLADFLRTRLQNYRPEVAVVPARRRGTPHSPDDPAIVAPIFESNYVMMGPGSPTYASQQLAGSLAWYAVLARHRLGSPLVLASAATIAAGTHVLPVYEIYKVGEDLHWKPGLDLLGPFGLPATFVPHWNNNEGGEDLDTSRCFMGRVRFERLREMLPPEAAVVGIDEYTSLVIDFEAGYCKVMGQGGVVVTRHAVERRFSGGEDFGFAELGEVRTPLPDEGIPSEVWESALAAEVRAGASPEPSAEIWSLVEARRAARARRDWATADRLRADLARLGWQLDDTPQGPQLSPLPRAS